MRKPVVFLHIPKTAGQNIHNELSRVLGAENVSPIRVHTQADDDQQLPPGYDLYSGHLDWTELDTLPPERFVFTVLRDPRERIASFYFFLLNQARGLSEEELQKPQHTGLRHIRKYSANDYFFGGDKLWQRFIRDHYDNFYCSYLATRKVRGWGKISDLSAQSLVDRAIRSTKAIDRIYTTTDLSALERDTRQYLGAQIAVADNYFNIGAHTPDERRWPKLLARLENDASQSMLEAFATTDEILIKRLGLAV